MCAPAHWQVIHQMCKSELVEGTILFRSRFSSPTPYFLEGERKAR